MRLLLPVCVVFLAWACTPQQARAQAQPNAGHPTLTLVNRSGQTIEELYVSTTRNTDWGSDRLGQSTVERNTTFKLRLSDGCLYDLQVVYTDHRTEERMRVNLCRTPMQIFTAAEAHAAPSEPSHHFVLDNQTGRMIVALSLADTDDQPGLESWGENLVTDGMAAGAHGDVTFTGACDRAVRVVFDNGGAEQRHGIELCGDETTVLIAPGWATDEHPGPPAPPALPVTITNRSTARMTELFVFPDDGLPGPDRLGVRVLDPGAETQIALDADGKCRFTIRAVFEGDTPDTVDRGLDFCPRRTVEVGAK